MGEQPITSLEDDSNNALIMKANYDLSRDSLLELHEWSFAMDEWIPAVDPTPPDWVGANRFRIPADLLRITAVEPNRNGPLPAYSGLQRTILRRAQADYVVESGFIVTDEEGIVIRGIRRMEDEGRFSNLFCDALSARLATDTCFAFTEDSVKWNAMSALYQVKLSEAKTRDGMQGTNRRIRNRTWQNVR
jgi:hypothetical protein